MISAAHTIFSRWACRARHMRAAAPTVTIVLLLLVVPLAAAAPEHVHLGIPSSDTSTEVSVVWTEAAPRNDARVVLTGPDGAAKPYPATAVQGHSIRTVYEARLTGLTAATTYTYAIDDRTFTFTTPNDRAPAAGTSVRFVALGDQGAGERGQRTTTAIEAEAPAFVLHAGDIAYGEGRQNEWLTWFDMVEPVAANVPWITALGNHETYIGTGTTTSPPNPLELAYYRQMFSLPGNEFWYSFDRDGIHFVVVDTYSDMNAPTPEQLAWLKKDLAANRNATWTVAMLHETIYSSNRHGSHPELQTAFSAIFEEGGVDVVIQGHDHGHERSYPLKGGKVANTNVSAYTEGDGVIYMVTGGGGRGLYEGWEEPKPAWSATRKSTYHYVAFEATATTLTGRVVTTADDRDYADTFTITKADAGTPPAAAPQGEAEAATPGIAGVLAIVAIGCVALLRRR